MTFWYQVNYVDGMSFKSSQEVDGNVIELWHSLEATTRNWVFGEMPLQRRYMKSKVLQKIFLSVAKTVTTLCNFRHKILIRIRVVHRFFISRSLLLYDTTCAQ